MAVGQFVHGSCRRNQAVTAIVGMTASQSSELECAGDKMRLSFRLKDLEDGAVISRRFPLCQGSKIGLVGEWNQ